VEKMLVGKILWAELFFMIVEIFLYSLLLIIGLSRVLGTKRVSLGIIARGKRKRGKKWMWIAKPGDRCYTLKAIIQEGFQGIRRDP
jgi:hypothetical protein